MSAKKVSLIRVCKTNEGWRRYPVAIGGNGKIRPGFAVVKGKQVHFPEGHYALRMYEDRKTVYKSVGNDASDALAALKRESHMMLVRDSAGAAGVVIPEETPGRVNLSKKKEEFIMRQQSRGHQRASETALIAIDDFIDATKHTYLDQITEKSVLAFYKYLRKRGNQDRTVFNKHASLFGFFKWLGVDTKKLAEKPPSYTEQEVEIYHPDDLKTLLEHCDEYQKAVFETLLMTGMRMQEAMHLEWENVDFRSKKIRVRERQEDELGDAVSIKDRAQRSVPMPDDLAVTLATRRKASPGARLVLGTKNDTPNWKWLLMLKRAVRRAGLNCGSCASCRSTKECSKWKIHRFRATYTTTLLRSNIDVRTVMAYTGHSDMATVLRYLAPSGDPNMQQRLSAISWV